MSPPLPGLGALCLITGGFDFNGSSLARRPCDFGAVVTVIDCLLPQFGWNRFNLQGYEERIQAHVFDLREGTALASLLEGQEVIFNLAAQTSHLDSIQDLETDLAINVTAQLRLLERCRQAEPNVHLVYASTRKLYGRPQYPPVDESHPIHPVDVNGINKLSAEMYHILYPKLYDLSAYALRLTNKIGRRMPIRDARQTLHGVLVRQLLEGKPIEVWGGEQ